MTGWKTWAAAGGLTALAIAQWQTGDKVGAVEKLSAALALIGIGHKIEKATPTKLVLEEANNADQG